jgi:hypothetical protein
MDIKLVVSSNHSIIPCFFENGKTPYVVRETLSEPFLRFCSLEIKEDNIQIQFDAASAKQKREEEWYFPHPLHHEQIENSESLHDVLILSDIIPLLHQILPEHLVRSPQLHPYRFSQRWHHMNMFINARNLSEKWIQHKTAKDFRSASPSKKQYMKKKGESTCTTCRAFGGFLVSY